MRETPSLAKRLDAIEPSATAVVTQRARELRESGLDVLSFSMGEPDFDTPAHIAEAGREAIATGATRYTATRGTLALRRTICATSAERRGGHRHDPSEVVVSVGAKHVLFNLALVLYDPGDEVIIPAPYWVSYPEQVRLAQATPVIVETTMDEGFCLTPQKLAAAVSSRTKAVILCSPSNPTGAAYTAEQLAELAEVARRHDFWILVDEIYAQIVYEGFEQRSILEVAPDLRDRIIIIDGVSKTFAMTGWRVGWMLGPAKVASACNTVQSQATTNPAAMAQQAAIAALEGPREPVESMRAAYAQRRALLVEGLNAIDGFSCRMPEGAFYAFPSVVGLVGRKHGERVLTDDRAVASYLLDEALCAVVPGTAFGAPGHLRFSYAASNADIREGLARIERAVAALL